YLSSKGMNSVYHLTMNVKGDGKDVWPWTSPGERFRFDCSKLDQWEIVFSHMDSLGLMLHVITQETEIDTDREFDWNDRGGIGRVRKLYYRELVARFGHHLAITWNLGEENTNTDRQRKLFADRLKALDPYDHPVVVHTYPGRYDKVYGPLLEHRTFDGPSLQMGRMRGTHSETAKWVERSTAKGRKWIVCLDEIGPASVGVEPDKDDPDHDGVRKDALWGNLMAGGAGCEWYFGYKRAHNDLNCEDWRSRDRMWDQTRHAIEFFQTHLPFTKMRPSDGLISSPNSKTGDYCFALPGVVYAVYLKGGGTTELDLGASVNAFTVEWYDPRKGGALQEGSVSAIKGPGRKSIGTPPRDAGRDWAALVRLSGSVRTHALTVTGGAGGGSYPEGAGVAISAGPPPEGETFDRWTGDVASVTDVRAPVTTITMPPGGATVTAAYRDAPARDAAAREGAPEGQAVLSFTLIDADADRPVPGYDPVRAGATLNLAKLPTRRLNIRANTSPREVGSVRFDLDGKAGFHTESSTPYALAGDAAGDYNAWTPEVGSHTLTATPYAESGARGKAGTKLTITFEVIDDPNR
ncbi:MAG: InlB B-repeat-containing protein, partial [Planctomycetota bacterium]